MPKLRFRGFHDDWNTSMLGKLGSFIKGAPLSKADISVEGTPFILYGELYTTYKEVANKIVRKTLKTADNECFSRIGDVIIPTSGETPEEIATATCVMLPDVILAGDLNIYRNNAVDGRIISYIINHVVNKDISRIAQGKSVVHIKADELAKIQIHYPSKSEQIKLLNFLHLLDAQIEKQQLLVELIKSYKRGLESIIFETKYENTFCLSDILVEHCERSTINNQHPIISSTKQGLFMQSEYFNKQAASLDTRDYKILRHNQIVFSPQNLWMGNINYNNKYDIGIVSPSYKIYNIKSGFDSKYIGYLMRSNCAIREYVLASEQGASIVRRNLNLDLFYAIKFSIPEINTQYRFSNMLENLDSIINKHTDVLSNLLLCKKELLQQLFI